MLRQIMVPSKENPTLALPMEWYGEEIEIIAFPVKVEKQNNAQSDKMNVLESFLDFANSNKVIEKGFKFNREACYDR